MKGAQSSAARRSSSAIVALAALSLGAAVALAVRAGGDWPALVAHQVARVTGWCALSALVGALAVTPLRRVIRLWRPEQSLGRALAPLRRTLGITAAAFAIVHGAFGFFGPLAGTLEAVLSWPYLRAGLGALLILVALLATSFPKLNRRLHVRLWKPLHRLSYAAAALALLHAFTGPFAPRALVAGVAALWALLLLLRLVPARAQDSRRQ